MANKKQDFSQFGNVKPVQSGNPQDCARCEAMLTDALDGTLSTADQAAFDLHLVSCTTCSEMVADARRGAAWLEMLRSPRPEPPSVLVERILAQTIGQLGESQSSAAQGMALASTTSSNALLGRPMLVSNSGVLQASSNVLPFRRRIAASFKIREIGHTLLQPRLAMTAAMAFFSIALTLNLAGIKVSEFKISDLRPSSIKRNVSEVNAHVVRYYDNLRVVYELESRVHDLQGSSESEGNFPSSTSQEAPAKSPDSKPADTQQPNQQDQDKQDQEQKAKPRPTPGTSRREEPAHNLHFVVADAGSESGRQGQASSLPRAVTNFAVLFPSVSRFNPTSPLQEGRLV